MEPSAGRSELDYRALGGVLLTDTLETAFFFFFLNQWCACAGDDKRVCPGTRGRIPQLHDCPNGS